LVKPWTCARGRKLITGAYRRINIMKKPKRRRKSERRRFYDLDNRTVKEGIERRKVKRRNEETN